MLQSILSEHKSRPRKGCLMLRPEIHDDPHHITQAERLAVLWLNLVSAYGSFSHVVGTSPVQLLYSQEKQKSHPWLQLLSEGVFKDSDISMAPDEEKHHNWLYDLSSPVALTTNLIIKWTEVVCKLLMSKPVTSLQLEHSWITFYDFICAWM